MNKTVYTVAFLMLSLLTLYSCKDQERKGASESKSKTSDTVDAGFKTIAYWTGRPQPIKDSNLEKLDQIIYSFLHLEGAELKGREKDSLQLMYLSSLKEKYPKLEILVSLGGWGGCKTCSEVFASENGRAAFSASVKKILETYKVDGIDLDWEYPGIAGFPDHQFLPEDTHNFTLLVEELRKTLGDSAVISFAAGGFDEYLEKSIEWKEVMAVVDHVNLMSYDLVNGNTPHTGHLTSLYATEEQQVSTDHAVKFLDSVGVAPEQIIIGAAFYARIWENVPDTDHGLYQQGDFKMGVSYKKIDSFVNSKKGFKTYWDTVAQATYNYSPDEQLFMTYDDPKSLRQKVQYVKDNNLGGIMFWELSGDTENDTLLNTIELVKKND
ncbi:glycoside hydrolase family 18 protein [Christiangramia flava]|uniref:chitinase n=1 Tax=Christiangramia flava JLT2011 TaxID=1229726 RepID=A0A1L7I3I2_9FLAO|nr:glycoside hydrolase family 18 protein [Christiangramia flava]APU68131.1 Chitinase [Christiangramia flava JLT2011]OSS41085.1 Chitinase [Christiangramia flava JLT2011]